MEHNDNKRKTAIFFCQQLDGNQDISRRTIEREFGRTVQFFPLPCSGRIEPVHLLRALESGVTKVYLLTCPEGACRYTEGNTRAGKRLTYVQGLLKEIGYNPQDLEMIRLPASAEKTIDVIARELLSRQRA